MICLKCGAGNPEDAHFCQNCGASLQSMGVCSTCQCAFSHTRRRRAYFSAFTNVPKNPRKKRLYRVAYYRFYFAGRLHHCPAFSDSMLIRGIDIRSSSLWVKNT